jgi:TP901 family phage tail tape measure protein
VTTPSRNIVARIDGDSSGFTRAAKSAEQSAKVFTRELKKVEQASQQHAQAFRHVAQMRERYEKQELARAAERRQAMAQVGQAAFVAGAAVAAGVALSVRAAVQWESAWAGVEKTVDGNARQMAVLEGELRELAKTLPASHREIAAVAEAAGQLGIKREAIAGFTRVMIDLGETTNLTADQAATSIAQIANIMGTAPDEIDRMGAALVALGNNGASTEADIVQMALRIAGAGKQVGLAEADVFAMANALASVGINAEAGGSAISRFMMDMSVGVETGSASVKAFADVAGLSVEQFSTLFREDAVGAVGAFTDGLGRISESGGSAIATLEQMGITEIRVRDALLRLAGAQGLLTASVDLGREAWEANSALVAEAEKRYATTEAKMQIAKNAVNDLAVDLGAVLLPALASAAEGVADLAGWLGDLPGPVKDTATVVGVLAATVGILGGGALMAVPKLAAMRTALETLKVSAATTDKAMKALTTTMKAGAIVGATVGVALAIDQLVNALADSPPEVNALTKALQAFARDGQATGELTRILGQDFESLDAKIRRAGKTKYLDSVLGGPGAIEKARRDLGSMDEALAALASSGQELVAADFFARWSAATGQSVEELSGDFERYQEALALVEVQEEQGTAAAQALAAALGGVDVSVNNAFSSLGAYADAMGMSEDATKDLTKQVETWADSLADFVQPLSVYTDLLSQKEEAERKSAEETAAATKSTKDSWEDYADAVSVGVNDYLGELQKQVEAQEAHADNMTRLAGRVSQGTLDELARMGPEGAPLVAELVNASDAELAKLDELFGRRTKEATGAMAGELYLASVLLPQIAAKAGTDTAIAIATALANGTTTIAQVAAQYGYAVESGVVPPVTRTATEVTRLARGLEGLDGRNVDITIRTLYRSVGTPGTSVPRAVGVGGGLTSRATGGILPGAPSDSDNMLIAAASGEFVVNARQSARYRGVLEAINSGRLPGFATGGGVGNPLPRHATLSGEAARVIARGGGVEGVRALVEAWEEYNRALEQAARRQELVTGQKAAQREYDTAKGIRARTEALGRLNEANQRLREFDAAAIKDRERKAVNQLVERLEAEADAREKAQRAAEELAEARQRAAEAAQDEADRSLNALNRMLDQEKSLRRQLSDSAEQFRAGQARLAARGADELRRYQAEQAELRTQQTVAEREHLLRMHELGVQFTDDQAALLADRRDRLANATALDQAIDFRRGLPADWLVANARRQVEALAEWMEQLDLARRMGVSEAVIEALGLDEGPQALAQVRALTRASAQEITDLNAVVGERTRTAGEQVRREQVGNYGQLGEQLVLAQQRYAAAVADLQADYRAGQQRFAEDLLDLQAGYLAAQQQLEADLTALQAEFVAEQEALSAELAAIGQEQGRSYGEAIAEGLRSQIPAVQAAARALQEAMTGLANAQADAAAAADAAAQPVSTPTRPDVNGVLPGPWKRQVSSPASRGLAFPNAKPGTVEYGQILGGPYVPQQSASRTVNFMPNARVTLKETLDADTLLHRAEFLVQSGGM